MRYILPHYKRRYWLPLLVLISLLLSTLACNLTSPPPPTVPPRLPTSTPQAPIGISTLPPLALPTGMPADIPAAPSVEALLQQIDSNLLMQHVQTLAGFETRYVNSTQSNPTRGIGAARTYIHDTLASYAAQAQGRMTVWDHPFTITWENTQSLQYNVVATIQGTESGAGVIIIAAHYDSTATDSDPSLFAPGADDNGSGIAALLEIARIMSQTPHRATIILTAFSAEEIGRVGSIRFIDDYLSSYDIDVRATLTLDTIGNVHGANNVINDTQLRIFSDDEYNSGSRQLSRVLNLIAATYVPELQVVIIAAGDREGRWGDHMSFTARGYPAVRFIEGIQDPARQNNSKDTVEYVNPTYLNRSTRVALASLAVLADGLPPPDNLSIRSNTANATLVWEPVPGAVGYVIALRQPNALVYHQVLNVGPTNTLTWDGFNSGRYETAAIAAIDDVGRWGQFSDEFPISQ